MDTIKLYGVYTADKVHLKCNGKNNWPLSLH